MAFEQITTQDCPNQVTLYQDENIQIGKFVNEDPYLYLIQEEYCDTVVIGLDRAAQVALLAILKNSLEA